MRNDITAPAAAARAAYAPGAAADPGGAEAPVPVRMANLLIDRMAVAGACTLGDLLAAGFTEAEIALHRAEAARLAGAWLRIAPPAPAPARRRGAPARRANIRDREPALTAEIGARIRAARTSRGISQECLAGEIGVTFQQIQKYERGANRVAASTLVSIAAALGCPVAELLPAGAGGVHGQPRE